MYDFPDFLKDGLTSDTVIEMIMDDDMDLDFIRKTVSEIRDEESSNYERISLLGVYLACKKLQWHFYKKALEKAEKDKKEIEEDDARYREASEALDNLLEWEKLKGKIIAKRGNDELIEKGKKAKKYLKIIKGETSTT